MYNYHVVLRDDEVFYKCETLEKVITRIKEMMRDGYDFDDIEVYKINKQKVIMSFNIEPDMSKAN